MINSDTLAATVTGRTGSLFEPDMRSAEDRLGDACTGRRVLVVGGAGTIGAATTREIMGLRPAALHVVDQDENGLAELVRDTRSTGLAGLAGDLRVMPLDLGSSAMSRLLRETSPYDIVLNFAALKHVRSEKDVYSLLQMLDTNLVRAARLLEALKDSSPGCRYFAVSTDKAANPASLMGASKRLMEHLLMSDRGEGAAPATVTSARFANVAFSAGSLLESVLNRVARRQLVAVPDGVSRFFISSREGAQVSMLAAAVAPDAHILVPTLEPDGGLQDLRQVVGRVLQVQGFEAREYRDEDEARAAFNADLLAGRYPVLVTPLDTAGEKPYEEFVGHGEEAVDLGFSALRGIRHVAGPDGSLERLLERLRGAVADDAPPLDKATVVSWLRDAVPEMDHVEANRSLDDHL